MSELEKQILIERLNRDRKSKGITWLLWFFLGTFGVHNFYMKNNFLGALELICWALTIATCGASSFLLLGLLIYDAFKINSTINEINNDIDYKVAKIVK